jgi:hypothetical protein
MKGGRNQEGDDYFIQSIVEWGCKVKESNPHRGF